MKKSTLNCGSLSFAVMLWLFGPFNIISPGSCQTFSKTGGRGFYAMPRYVSFNPDNDKIEMDLDLSIPFLSIPLNSKGKQDKGLSTVNINFKAVAVAVGLTALITFFVSLFMKHSYDYQHRSDDEWQTLGERLSGMFFENSYVAPCVQRAVCSAVSKASHAINPTSTEKIIDGVSSHSWFEQMTNGTPLRDAVVAGRKGKRDCSAIYSGCFVNPRLVQNILESYRIL